MTNRAIDLIAPELQQVPLPASDTARAAGLAGTLNDTIRQAADRLLAFEDEPAHYTRLMEQPR